MNTIPDNVPGSNDAAAKGAAVYNKPVLSIYDWFVLGFSNTFVWRCPSRLILEFYNEHISEKHLDVGVGTGYFLDKCKFHTNSPVIALMDLNLNSLHRAARRLQRYKPKIHIANVLEPLRVEPGDFDSIGLNYLFHCLPGNLLSKGVVFRNLLPLLNPNGGVMFGTTILGSGVKHNFLAKTLMRIYNSKGIFSNMDDKAAELNRVLHDIFSDYSIRVFGCVAFFTARI